MRLRAKEYERMQECVENGARWGWMHAHKHIENPTEEQMVEHMERDIMSQICEEFEFEPYED